MDQVLSDTDKATATVFSQVVDYLESNYPNAYLASFFKNANKCRELNNHLTSEPAGKPSETTAKGNVGQQKLLFGSEDSNDQEQNA